MIIHKDFDLTMYNSYRIRSTSHKAIFPEHENDFIEIFRNEKNIILLGSGHNIILSKEYYEETFVIVHQCFNHINIEGTCVEVEAGAWMTDVASAVQERGLSGLEVFYDIPSSLGGAIVMNAGASGEEIKDVLVKVRYLDLDDFQIKEILKDEMSFEYRNSFFQRNTNKIVLKAWLNLTLTDREIVKNKMELIKEQRWAKQPKEFPNAGSVFKRPKGFYVGAMIDELKLKGYSVGGAKISEKHGGFIVNFNDAKGQDIIDIINEVKRQVLDRFQVDLEVEQRII